jgi:hypothetical protein
MERIRRNFASWPHAIIVRGRVPEVLPQVTCEAIAFLHLDMNSALPERAALEHFWPRLSRGAVVLFDDYAYRGYEEQGDSIDAVAASVGATVLALPTGQGLMIK